MMKTATVVVATMIFNIVSFPVDANEPPFLGCEFRFEDDCTYPYTGFCYVDVDFNSTLNVRRSPEGQIVNQLQKDRVVYIEDTFGQVMKVGYDEVYGDIFRHEWVLVQGPYQDDWRQWGWVYSSYLECPD